MTAAATPETVFENPATAPAAHTAPVVTMGETMGLVSGARIGSFAHVDQTHVSIGGAESNVAVGLSRVGVPVRWIGRVGDDSLGTRVTRELRGEQIDVRAVIDTEAATGLMLKELTGPGTSRVVYYRSGSAGSRLSAGDLPPGIVEDASVLHLTGITPLLSSTAREACVSAVHRAQAAGVTVSLDVNYRKALAPADRAAEVLGELAAQADLLFGSVEELAMVLGAAAPTLEAIRTSVNGPGTSNGRDASDRREVIAKLGEDGGVAFTGEGEFRVPGHAIDVVDTVGAGDSFVAGYLSGLVDGWNVDDRLARANACGAYTCTIPGDWEGAPTLRDLGAFGTDGVDPVRR